MLRGLLKCGNCGALMVETSAKGGKYASDMDLIPRGKLEKLVVEKLKGVVLTEENLKELVDLIFDKLEEGTEDLNSRHSFFVYFGEFICFVEQWGSLIIFGSLDPLTEIEMLYIFQGGF